MKNLQVVRFDSSDGDAHFVFLETPLSKNNPDAQDYDEVEMKKTSKKDASKPLLLNRAE